MNEEASQNKLAQTVQINQAILLKENACARKNIGYAALSRIYHELGLHVFINNRSRMLNTSYIPNSILKLLVYNRILAPASKKRAYESRDMYFENTKYSLDDIYRCLTHFNQLKDDIQRHMNLKITEQYKRNTEMVYYDVTNYYFAIDEQDTLRRKGVSKEHRPDPIVQMGLFMDTNGIPISYELFPGNTNDCETLITTMSKLKQDYGIGRTVVVADKGLNTSENIVFNILQHDGYVYSQTIRGGTKEFKEYVLSENGYTWINPKGNADTERLFRTMKEDAMA